MLSKRLKAIANLVDNNTKVIDIGSDHGLIPIFLTKFKNCDCIATDINKNCIITIKENLKKYEISDKIEVIKTDGLKNIDYTNSTVILAGMGTFEILNILKNNNPDTLIIQSNTDLYELRKELTKRYIIVSEIPVFEKNKCYLIIKFKLGNKHYSYSDLLIGPCIKKSNYDDYKTDYYKKNLYIYRNILFRNFKKKIKYFIIIKTLKCFKLH